MKKSDFTEVESIISGGPDQNATLNVDMDDFHDWIAHEWQLMGWEEWDWKKTRIPRFVFSIVVKTTDGDVEVDGEIDNNQWKRVIFFNASYKFIALFMRKFKDRFPCNEDIYTLISGYSYVKLPDNFSLQQIESSENDDILENILVDPGLSFMRKLGDM